jgi:hypothetical protein
MFIGFTEPSLIAYAGSQGVKVTPAQLKRWRLAALLPPIARRGLGRGVGTETRYPIAAGRWVVDLGRVLETDRNLGRAAWSLWLKGYPLTNHARTYLLGAASRIEAFLSRIAHGDLDRDVPAFREARRSSFVRVLLNAMAGLPVSECDLTSFNASVEAVAPGKFPLTKPEGVPPRMKALGEAIASASDETLIAVRDEVLMFRLGLEFVLEMDDVPMAPLILLWFGATRMDPAGQQMLREVKAAMANGQVPHLIERFRPAVQTVRALLKPLRDAVNVPADAPSRV